MKYKDRGIGCMAIVRKCLNNDAIIPIFKKAKIKDKGEKGGGSLV
jgi:hypothetical protein